MQQSQTGFNKTLMLRNRAKETEFDPPDKGAANAPLSFPLRRGVGKLGFFLRFVLSFYISLTMNEGCS